MYNDIDGFPPNLTSYMSHPHVHRVCHLSQPLNAKESWKNVYTTEGFNILIFLLTLLMLISAKTFIRAR